MQESDKPKFAQLMQALTAGFRVDASTGFFEMYWLALEDLPFAEVKAAAIEAMKTSKFMPAAAELRERAKPPSAGLLAPYHRPVQGYDVCAAHLYHRSWGHEECRKGRCPYYGQPFLVLTDGGN